jgi:hypothetical protein
MVKGYIKVKRLIPSKEHDGWGKTQEELDNESIVEKAATEQLESAFDADRVEYKDNYIWFYGVEFYGDLRHRTLDKQWSTRASEVVALIIH